MKTTVSKIRKEMPFLISLLDETEWKPNSRVRVEVHIDKPVELIAPFHDGCVRFTSAGMVKPNGEIQIKSHYAGCYDTCLCNPSEVLGVGIDGQTVKENCFYAIADSMEYYRIRTIDVYLRSIDVKELEALK